MIVTTASVLWQVDTVVGPGFTALYNAALNGHYECTRVSTDRTHNRRLRHRNTVVACAAHAPSVPRRDTCARSRAACTPPLFVMESSCLDAACLMYARSSSSMLALRSVPSRMLDSRRCKQPPPVPSALSRLCVRSIVLAGSRLDAWGLHTPSQVHRMPGRAHGLRRRHPELSEDDQGHRRCSAVSLAASNHDHHAPTQRAAEVPSGAHMTHHHTNGRAASGVGGVCA